MVSLFIEHSTFVQFRGLSGPISKQRNIRAVALLKRLGGELADVYNFSFQLNTHSENRKIHIHLLGKLMIFNTYV